MKTLLASSVLLFALTRGGEAPRVAQEETAHGIPPLRARLVGCDEYPYLREALGPEVYARDVRLQGPENDVHLMQLTLERVLGLEPARTEVLTGWGDEATRPTRANILAALERLRVAAQPGERVVVYLAGHGSQQRVQRDKGLEEPDGLDEIFLPADVRQAQRELGFVPNSLRDDELGAALRSIRDAGAEVLLLVDACHSGGLLRGGSTHAEGVRMRGLDPALLGVSLEQPLGRPAAGPAPLQRGWIGSSSSERLSALYGSQSYGRAPEMPAPRDGSEIHGLFTYVLCQELERSGGVGTYRELSERVIAAYQAFPCALTVPSAEGDLARGLEGGVASETRLLCGLRGDEPWLHLGRLAGVERGLVARVYARRGDDKPLARVEVLEAGLFEARARLLEGKLGAGLFPAEVERRSFGDWRLPIAVVDPGGRLVPDKALPGEVQSFLEHSRERFPRVQPALADWWVVCSPAPGDASAPSELQCLRPGPSEGGCDFFGVRPSTLGADLEKIQHARVLCDYASSALTSGWTGELELVIERKARPPERLGRDALLHPGDQIRIALDKRTERIFDVHVFYVDANAHLLLLFPQGHQSPRLGADVHGEKPLMLTHGPKDEWLPIVDNALGVEHVLVFATPRTPESPEVDLSFLMQGGVLRGSVEGGPFQRLLQHVARGQDMRGESLAVSSDVEGTQSLLVTLRTEWGALAPPAWPRTGVVALEAPSGLPASAPPDPWEHAARAALMASPPANGKSDVLLLRDEQVRAVLIDFEGGIARAQDLSELVRTRGFGADAAFVFAADGRWALYRTRAEAEFDLALLDRDLDGVADERWARAQGAPWSHVTGVALPWLSQGYLWRDLTGKAEDCTARLGILRQGR